MRCDKEYLPYNFRLMARYRMCRGGDAIDETSFGLRTGSSGSKSQLSEHVHVRIVPTDEIILRLIRLAISSVGSGLLPGRPPHGYARDAAFVVTSWKRSRAILKHEFPATQIADRGSSASCQFLALGDSDRAGMAVRHMAARVNVGWRRN
jgi:hypothetical protein